MVAKLMVEIKMRVESDRTDVSSGPLAPLVSQWSGKRIRPYALHTERTHALIDLYTDMNLCDLSKPRDYIPISDHAL